MRQAMISGPSLLLCGVSCYFLKNKLLLLLLLPSLGITGRRFAACKEHAVDDEADKEDGHGVEARLLGLLHNHRRCAWYCPRRRPRACTCTCCLSGCCLAASHRAWAENSKVSALCSPVHVGGAADNAYQVHCLSASCACAGRLV